MSARRAISRTASPTTPISAICSNRLRRMVAETRALEVVVTHTEVEALLLECNLIKRFMPRYNVLLRDDKSFPYIHLTGARIPAARQASRRARRAGRLFRPLRLSRRGQAHPDRAAEGIFATVVHRQHFATRTRPCLLFQIKRCCAPCVGRIDEEGYAKLVEDARAFLKGRSQDVQARLATTHEGEIGGARLRRRGADPRPHPRADPGAGPAGHQRPGPGRCRCHRRPPGRAA